MKRIRNRLFTPGPTPIPDFISRKMGEPIIHHRKAQFIEIFQAVRQGLKYVFQTDQEVLVLSASGTGGMEAAIVNLLAPGDTVITVDAGKFGERWGELCQIFGISPVVIKKEWGKAVQPAEIVQQLRQHPESSAVFLTYSETSTGVAIDLPAIARVIRENSSALIVVDCISALVALPLKMDEWQLDVVISASQKGFMLPPGLAFVALSQRAMEMAQKARLPNYYLSFQKALKAVQTGTTPFTPASTIVIGLKEAIDYIQTKGIENIWKEHQTFAEAIRAAVQAMGLQLLTAFPSNAVTAVLFPETINGVQFINLLHNEFGVVVAGGQGPLKNKIFRVGHVGYYDALDIISVVAAIEWAFRKLGWQFKSAAGLQAAEKILAELYEDG